MLEEMIVSDPQWIRTCAPARAKMWELAQASHEGAGAALCGAQKAGFIPAQFWDTLGTQPPAELTRGGDYATQCPAI